jgi:hypothetical protein
MLNVCLQRVIRQDLPAMQGANRRGNELAEESGD